MAYDDSRLNGLADTPEVEVVARPATCHARRRWHLGMPQLDACGLSETWLQKTCGDRHWQALAQLCDRAPQAWTDGAGRRVYAAFCYLRLSEARLARPTEGQWLSVHSTTQMTGRAQALSHHRLALGREAIGRLDLLSVFVGRADGVSNRSVQRVDLCATDAAESAEAARLKARVKAMRAEALAREVPAGAPVMGLMPCPRSDYNGAGLLYFASFTALADRALWQWGRLSAHDQIVDRECVFLGNLDIGESLCVALVDERSDGRTDALDLQITAAADGRVLVRMRLSVARGPRPPRAP